MSDETKDPKDPEQLSTTEDYTENAPANDSPATIHVIIFKVRIPYVYISPKSFH